MEKIVVFFRFSLKEEIIKISLLLEKCFKIGKCFLKKIDIFCSILHTSL